MTLYRFPIDGLVLIFCAILLILCITFMDELGKGTTSIGAIKNVEGVWTAAWIRFLGWYFIWLLASAKR